MRIRTVLAALALSFTGLATGVSAQVALSTAGEPAAQLPVLEGPVAVTATSRPYVRDEEVAPGYVAEEFFVTGSIAGRPFKTLVHVRRPADPAKASGVVIVEPWHRGDNWAVNAGQKNYIVRSSHSHVVILSHESVLRRFISQVDPARYGTLTIPEGDAVEWEILARVGALAKRQGIPGLRADKLILAGKSSSAAVIRNYIINQGQAARLDGRSIYDGYFPIQSAIGATRQPLPETDVPVVETQGERELILHIARDGRNIVYRRPDGPFYRLYEFAGVSHITTRNLDQSEYGRTVSAAAYSDPRTWRCDATALSPYPVNEVNHAALALLVRWVTQGVPAPEAPRIELTGDGQVARDLFGNARGGYPSVLFDVPAATYFATKGPVPQNPEDQRCDWIGGYEPFAADRLQSLYGNRIGYLERFDARLDELIRDGWYLAEDAADLRIGARADFPE